MFFSSFWAIQKHSWATQAIISPQNSGSTLGSPPSLSGNLQMEASSWSDAWLSPFVSKEQWFYSSESSLIWYRFNSWGFYHFNSLFFVKGHTREWGHTLDWRFIVSFASLWYSNLCSKLFSPYAFQNWNFCTQRTCQTSFPACRSRMIISATAGHFYCVSEH